MLATTEFLEINPSLEIVLWIEVVVYVGIGVYEFFDDFIAKPQPWMTINKNLTYYGESVGPMEVTTLALHYQDGRLNN